LKTIDKLSEEEWLSSYRYQEFNKKANFSSLEEFKEAVRKEAKDQLQTIKDKLNIIKERYNLSLEDICQTWNITKEELFKRIGIGEGEFLEMVNEH